MYGMYIFFTYRKQDTGAAMKKEAKDLMQQAGLGDHQGPCGIPELQRIQQVCL